MIGRLIRRLVVAAGVVVACFGLGYVAWYVDRVASIVSACADAERGTITNCTQVRERLGRPSRAHGCTEHDPTIGMWPRPPIHHCAEVILYMPPLPLPPTIAAWACDARGQVVDYYRFESP